MISAKISKENMAKDIAEQSNRLSIFWLKKNGYLPKGGGIMSGIISWTYGLSENKSSIGFSITTNIEDEEDHIELRYNQTDRWSGEKENMNYKVTLTTTPCNYGSVRYWFICPLYKNSQYCGRRVGVLFNTGKYFGCRHCGDIAYYSQMQGGSNKGFVSLPDIERAEKEVKRYYYNGMPTRKYRRLLKLNRQFEIGLIGRMAMMDKRFEKFAKLKK